MNQHTFLVLALTGTLAAPPVQAQICSSYILHSSPDSRYMVNFSKDIVLDKWTGLTWKRCVEGQSGGKCGLGSSLSLNWGEALRQASDSNFAGYKDWRLPNSKELESLVEVACQSPAINVIVFPNDPVTRVWASSPTANSVNNAWGVDFDYGHSGYSARNNYNAVRLVRGGQ